jgi:hypothetical protein
MLGVTRDIRYGVVVCAASFGSETAGHPSVDVIQLSIILYAAKQQPASAHITTTDKLLGNAQAAAENRL